MNIVILDTDTELNKFYRNTFKKKYPEAKINFIYSSKDLFSLLENELKIHPKNNQEAAIPQLHHSDTAENIVTNEIEDNSGNAFADKSETDQNNVESDSVENIDISENENNEIHGQHVEKITNDQEEVEDETISSPKEEPASIVKKSNTIVIAESNVPDMDSFDFLEKMKEYNVPVVIVSSEHSERMIIECLRHGASDFLSKRNIKHGHFIDIIERALYIDENEKLKNGNYKKLNKLVLSSLKNEKSEKIRNRLSRGMLIEDDMELIAGEHYNIIYLYVQIKLSKELKTSIDANRLKYLYDKFLNRFSEISLKYGRKFGLRKMDGCLFGFANEGYFQALIAAMEILAQMNVYNVTTENLTGKIYTDIALTAGDTMYKDKIGDITSQSLNLCAHMAIKAKINHGILITKEIYKNIDPRAEKYFKKAGEFEGAKVYVYRTEKEKV